MNTLRYSLILSLFAMPLMLGAQVPAAGSGAGADAAVVETPAEDARASDEVVHFRFAPRQGDVSRSRVVTKAFGSMDMFGAMFSQKFSQTFEQDLVMKCLEVRPDGTSLFEMAIPAVAMKMNMGGLSLEIDTREEDPPPSKMPAQDMVRRLFTAMTRIKCNVTLSPEGEPLKVEGLSEGMKMVIDEISDQLVAGLRQFFDQFRDFLADDIMAEQMRSAFRIVPDGGQARVGDRWTREWQVTLPPFNVLTQGRGEYELLEMTEFRGRRCAKIRVRSSLSTLPGQKPDLSKLGGVPRGLFDRMQFSMTASGGDGIAYVDPVTGDLLHMRETQRTSLEISMEADPDAQQDELKEGLGKMAQKLTTSVQIDLVEKNGLLLPQDR